MVCIYIHRVLGTLQGNFRGENVGMCTYMVLFFPDSPCNDQCLCQFSKYVHVGLRGGRSPQ